MEDKSYIELLRNRLIQLQTMYDVSSRELSTGVGASSNYIQGIVSGNRRPSLEKVFEICDYFDIPPKVLFDFDKEIEKDSLRFQSLGEKLAPEERSYFIEVMEGYLILKEGRRESPQ